MFLGMLRCSKIREDNDQFAENRAGFAWYGTRRPTRKNRPSPLEKRRPLQHSREVLGATLTSKLRAILSRRNQKPLFCQHGALKNG